MNAPTERCSDKAKDTAAAELPPVFHRAFAQFDVRFREAASQWWMETRMTAMGRAYLFAGWGAAEAPNLPVAVPQRVALSP